MPIILILVGIGILQKRRSYRNLKEVDIHIDHSHHMSMNLKLKIVVFLVALHHIDNMVTVNVDMADTLNMVMVTRDLRCCLFPSCLYVSLVSEAFHRCC